MNVTKDDIKMEYGTDNGNVTVSVSASVNEGVDMSVGFDIRNTKGQPISVRTVTVNQTGRRCRFCCTDARFKSNGEYFNVLKS